MSKKPKKKEMVKMTLPGVGEVELDMSIKGVHCPVRLCEDPDTGEIFTVKGKDCPPGTYEKLAHQAMMHGVQFRFKKEDKKKEKEE